MLFPRNASKFLYFLCFRVDINFAKCFLAYVYNCRISFPTKSWTLIKTSFHLKSQLRFAKTLLVLHNKFLSDEYFLIHLALFGSTWIRTYIQLHFSTTRKINERVSLETCYQLRSILIIFVKKNNYTFRSVCSIK